MSEHLDRAYELRNDPEHHHNCAQGVLLPFASECGLDEEAACRIADHFGGGMRTGRTCGALTGALMALGLLGKGDPALAEEAFRRFEEAHGCVDCAQLLAASLKRGEERKTHCDGLVYEAVQMVEGLSAARA